MHRANAVPIRYSLLAVGLCTAALLLLSTAHTAIAAELVMFEEAGCVWCRKWHAEIGPGYPRTDEGRKAPLRRHDIRKGMPAGIQLDKPVTMTPTFVLVEDGVELGRILGYPGPDFFYPLLGELLRRLETLPSEPEPAAPAPIQRDAGMASPRMLR